MRIKKVDTAHPKVRDAILSMHAECFPGLDFQELHGDWWIAYEGLEPAGFAGLWPSARTAGAGYLCRAGVMPKARGKGLQRKLIKVREKEARKKEWVVLFSDTDPVNVHSMNNLVECGFRAFRPSVLWASKGKLWCYWRKVLSLGVA